MTSPALAPAPGAAPLTRMVAAQTRMEARLILRNGEQLLIAVVIPLIVLVAGVEAAKHVDFGWDGRDIDVLTPGVLALAVMSTSFTSLAIATGFERRYGVLKRLGASPLPRTGLLAGKVGAILLVELLQTAIIGAVGFALGWSPNGGIVGAVGAIATALFGTVAFASLGLLVAGTLRAEATLAVANLVYLLLMSAGAVVVPQHSYGGWGNVVQWLPSGALGGGLRESLTTGDFPLTHLLVLLAWGVIGSVLTTRTFRWE